MRTENVFSELVIKLHCSLGNAPCSKIGNRIKAQAEEDNWYQIREWLTAFCLPATAICIDTTCLYVLSASVLSYLKLLKEFYHTERHQITMPEDLPETFERCAEVIRQNLLSYQSQIDAYYNSCLKGKLIQPLISLKIATNEKQSR